MRTGSHPRHGRQDPDPSLAGRAVQRGVLPLAGGSRLVAPDHRGLSPAGERPQGGDHRRGADGRAAAPGHGRAHGGDRRGHRGAALMMAGDGRSGRFFEDFRLGETIRHATPRSLGEGEAALHIALTGSRFAVTSSAAFARDVGYAAPPLDDLLVFNMVFGKTVPDISLNAVANLGYADCRFLKPVSAGETLSAASEVIG